MSQPQSTERLLTPGEVAALFRVDPKTVTRWASAGRIGSIRTPGGHRRFRETEYAHCSPRSPPRRRWTALPAEPPDDTGRRMTSG